METKELLLIHKPKGITSFDVIRQLRKKLNIKKMGHAGTLDPLAEGLMIVGVGSGTKLLSSYIKLPKEYVAEILVGEERTTGDMEGRVTREVAVDQEFSDEEIRSVLQGMVGTLTLPVSAYSAIKKDGVPMYKRARNAEKEGREVEDVPVRNMEVYKAEYLGQEKVGERLVVRARFFVGSGTYIRSLAEEFGARLGYPATLRALTRTKIGDFLLTDAETL